MFEFIITSQRNCCSGLYAQQRLGSAITFIFSTSRDQSYNFVLPSFTAPPDLQQLRYGFLTQRQPILLQSYQRFKRNSLISIYEAGFLSCHVLSNSKSIFNPKPLPLPSSAQQSSHTLPYQSSLSFFFLHPSVSFSFVHSTTFSDLVPAEALVSQVNNIACHRALA